MTDCYLRHPDGLFELLKPETQLERQLLRLPDIQKGLLWGEPRFGHPEGQVALHVKEVLENVDRIPNLDPYDRWRLRLISVVHDAFKYMESRARPRDWANHHGLLARRFMESYTSDKVVLDIIETHDDVYYKWLSERRKPSPHQPLGPLHSRVGYCWQFYYIFFKCDTQTGDKTQAPLRWFEATAQGIEVVKIRPYWPWENDEEG